MKISIDGNIGAGKTTILKKLTNYDVILEPVEEWTEHLTKFYEDPIRWGFCFNLKVLSSFAKWHNVDKFILFERSPIACNKVFTDMHYEDGNMDKLELKTFNDIYDNIGWSPDVLIYIKTRPENCLKRIKIRGRESEQNISIEYLDKVHKKYEELIIKHKTVIIIDGERDTKIIYEEIKNIIDDLYCTHVLVSK
jgi:deoxyadenosine/deoxycytidine kinase